MFILMLCESDLLLIGGNFCQKLLNFEIIADKCKGCTLCARQCPVNAISGKVKEPHVIDQNKCIKCGACMEGCKFSAIIKK